MAEFVRQPATDQQIQTDLTCLSCGYNLRSLSASSDCPECGLAVEQSRGLAVTRRWPLNAASSCEWIGAGLLMMIMLGLGLIIWCVALPVLIFRFETRSALATCLRYTTLTTLLLLVAIVGVAILAPSTLFRNERLLMSGFVVAANVHFVCIFAIAIRLTTDARMYTARRVAVVCFVSHGLFVLWLLTRPNDYLGASITTSFFGLCCSLIGGPYFLTLAGVLRDKCDAIRREIDGDAVRPYCGKSI